MADHSDGPYGSQVFFARQGDTFLSDNSFLDADGICSCAFSYLCTDEIDSNRSPFCVWRSILSLPSTEATAGRAPSHQLTPIIYRSTVAGPTPGEEKRDPLSTLVLCFVVLNIRGGHPHRCPWMIYHKKTTEKLIWFALNLGRENKAACRHQEQPTELQRIAYWTSRPFKCTFSHCLSISFALLAPWRWLFPHSG